MASRKYETNHRNDPPVKVHHSKGCDLCSRTDQHTHTQADWREHIDAVGERMNGGR